MGIDLPLIFSPGEDPPENKNSIKEGDKPKENGIIFAQPQPVAKGPIFAPIEPPKSNRTGQSVVEDGVTISGAEDVLKAAGDFAPSMEDTLGFLANLGQAMLDTPGNVSQFVSVGIPNGLYRGAAKSITQSERLMQGLTPGGLFFIPDEAAEDPDYFFRNSPFQRELENPAAEMGASLTELAFAIAEVINPIGAVGLSAKLGPALVATGGRVGAFLERAVTAGDSALAFMFGRQLVTDPFEQRISDMLHDKAPGLIPSVTEFLKTNPDDSEAEARLRLALEDMLFVTALEGPLAMFKALRSGSGKIRDPYRVVDGRPVESIADQRFPTVTVGDIETFGSPEAALRQHGRRFEDHLLNGLNAMEEGAARESTLLAAQNTYREALRRADPTATMFTPDAIEGMVKRLANRVGKPIPRTKGSASSYEASIQAGIREFEESNKVGIGTILRKGRDLFVDHRGSSRAAIINRGGPAGEQAVMNLDLAQGAPVSADVLWKAARRDIYSPIPGDANLARRAFVGQMSGQDIGALNNLIRLDRDISLLQSRPDVVLEGGLRGLSGINELLGLRRTLALEIGPSRIPIFNQRVDKYFRVMRDQLTPLHEAGIISREELQKLSFRNFSPRELLEQIDPIVATGVERVGTKTTMSVTSSGINRLPSRLDKAGQGALNQNSQELLVQTISRVQGRVARNKVTQSLSRVAVDNPENGFVFMKRPPRKQGVLTTEMSYFEGGEKKSIFVEKDIASQLLSAEGHMSKAVTSFLSTVSAAPIVRTFATGSGNPTFFITGLPRDILQAQFATREFSAVLPVGVAQLGMDILRVGKDAFMRTGRYKAAINDGMGMSFLAQGARRHMGPNVIGTGARVWERMRGAGEYLNTTSELLVRLAIRERAIRNGRSPREASLIARQYIDFGAGGPLTKAVDTVIPYTNAAMQGLRSVMRTSTQSAGIGQRKMALPVAVLKASQMVGGFMWLWKYNQDNFPEVMDQVAPEVSVQNMIAPLGISRQDDQGNTRHLYLKAPIDPSLMLFKGVADSLMAFHENGKLEPDNTVEMFLGVGSLLGPLGSVSNMVPPSIKAVVEYATNYRLATRSPMFQGADVNNQFQTNEFPRRPTSQIARDLGSVTGLSPARLEGAGRSVLPRSPLTAGFSSVYSLIRGSQGRPEGEEANTFLDVFMNSPSFRRIVGEGHPLSIEGDRLKELSRNANDPIKVRNNELDAQIARGAQRGVRLGNIPDDTRQWISTQPFQEQERLFNRYINGTWLRQNASRLKVEGFPYQTHSPSWWTSLGAMAPNAQAEAIYEIWRGIPASKRGRFLGLARSLPSIAGGDKFELELQRLMNSRGDNADGIEVGDQ